MMIYRENMAERNAEEREAHKRSRPEHAANHANPQPSAVDAQQWPAVAQLYEQGLASRAEALSSTGFAVDGRSWRQQAFAAADHNDARLRQRQAEMRRVLLRKAM